MSISRQISEFAVGLKFEDLPDEVVQAAAARYEEIFQKLTGIPLADFQPPQFSEPR